MAGRPRTRARMRAPVDAMDAASMTPVKAIDDHSMRVPFAAPRHEEMIPAPMCTMRDLVELARYETRANILALVRMRDDASITPMVRVAATGMLLDRAYGKPHQSIAIADVSDKGQLDLSALSGDELRMFETLLTKASAPAKPAIDVTPGGVIPRE